jgi:hypothetical protein
MRCSLTRPIMQSSGRPLAKSKSLLGTTGERSCPRATNGHRINLDNQQAAPATCHTRDDWQAKPRQTNVLLWVGGRVQKNRWPGSGTKLSDTSDTQVTPAVVSLGLITSASILPGPACLRKVGEVLRLLRRPAKQPREERLAICARGVFLGLVCGQLLPITGLNNR